MALTMSSMVYKRGLFREGRGVHIISLMSLRCIDETIVETKVYSAPVVGVLDQRTKKLINSEGCSFKREALTILFSF